MDKSFKDPELIEWQFDITHDGINDRMMVNIKAIKDINQFSNEDPVAIYSGKTGNKIWTENVNTILPGYEGLYWYQSEYDLEGSQNNEEKKDYLIRWEPFILQGNGGYRYTVFYLSENGQEVVTDSDQINFKISETESKESDIELINDFVNQVNKYLSNAIVIIDTNIGFGNRGVVYSTPDHKIVMPYDASYEINAIKAVLKEGYVPSDSESRVPLDSLK